MYSGRVFQYSILFTFLQVSVANSSGVDVDKLADLSFSDLGNIVTSVSKRPEEAFTAPAAVYVITQSDIQSSGLRTIPEILRMAPGVQVAQSDTLGWAITSRGFNSDGFGNKLLVMIDGRSVYTPLFSGVYWDAQDTFIDDIDRIEIIRGPGATLWGANAVNGVINIITKKAKDTQTNVVSAGIGSETKNFVEARVGRSYKNNIFYRVYAKRFQFDSSKTTAGDDGKNDGRSERSGFKADWENSNNDEFTVQGDIYDNRANLELSLPDGSTRPDALLVSGGNLLTKWNHEHSNASKSSVQMYFDKASADYSLLHQDNYTYDFDYQYNTNIGEKNNLTTGVGYRYITDDLQGSTFLSYTPVNRGRSLFSTFIQDTYKIVPDKVHLTFGSKFEKNDFTGFEVQPSARAAWYPNLSNTLWASVSRAVRTPNRSEDNLSMVVAPGYLRWQGNRNFKSEELVAYELGYKVKATENLLFDATTFINKYDRLRTNELSDVNLPADTVLGLPFDNKAKATSQGFELAPSWLVTKYWKLKGSYTYLTMDIKTVDGSTDTLVAGQSRVSPENQFSVQSQLYLPHSVELTNSLYYVDELTNIGISSYYRFDSRIMWTVKPGVELSLIGQNLLSSRHQEFSQPLNGLPNEIERNVYGKITVRF